MCCIIYELQSSADATQWENRKHNINVHISKSPKFDLAIKDFEIIFFLPGMMATVLRALSTRKVRKAARFPKSIPMVMYLQEKKCIWVRCTCFVGKEIETLDSFDLWHHFSPIPLLQSEF